MWHAAVLTSMVALTGFYSMTESDRLVTPRQATAASLTQSMAVYRQAVVNYHEQYGGAGAQITLGQLRAGGTLPDWSRLHTDPSPWENYKDANGLIYIYPSAGTPVNFVSDLLALSHQSELVTVYRAAGNTLYSPVSGRNAVPSPPPGMSAIPDGSPVWVASAQ